jgi:hypothetical protein
MSGYETAEDGSCYMKKDKCEYVFEKDKCENCVRKCDDDINEGKQGRCKTCPEGSAVVPLYYPNKFGRCYLKKGYFYDQTDGIVACAPGGSVCVGESMAQCDRDHCNTGYERSAVGCQCAQIKDSGVTFEYQDFKNSKLKGCYCKPGTDHKPDLPCTYIEKVERKCCDLSFCREHMRECFPNEANFNVMYEKCSSLHSIDGEGTCFFIEWKKEEQQTMNCSDVREPEGTVCKCKDKTAAGTPIVYNQWNMKCRVMAWNNKGHYYDENMEL